MKTPETPNDTCDIHCDTEDKTGNKPLKRPIQLKTQAKAAESDVKGLGKEVRVNLSERGSPHAAYFDFSRHDSGATGKIHSNHVRIIYPRKKCQLNFNDRGYVVIKHLS